MYNEYETEEIMTDRLILMKGKEKDFLSVYEFDFNKLKNIDDVFEFSKGDTKEIKKCFNKGSKVYYNKCKKAHVFDWIMFLEDRAIGNILAIEDNYEDKTTMLEVNVHPNHWGKGFAPEALVSVINFLFKIGYDNIICNYEDGNKKAKRLMQKLGFKAYKILNDGFTASTTKKVDLYTLKIEKEDWLSRTSKIKL